MVRLRSFVRAALCLEAAVDIGRLRAKPDMRHHRDAAVDQIAHRGGGAYSPASIFTAWQPVSFMIRAAFMNACSTLAS